MSIFNKKPNLLGLYHQELQAQFSFKQPKKAAKGWIKALTVLVWLVVFVTVACLINLWFILPSIKNAYQNSISAKTKLEQSFSYYNNHKLAEAKKSLTEAESLINQTLQDIKAIKRTPIAWTPYFKSQINDLEQVVNVTLKITGTAIKLTTSSELILSLLPDYSLPNYTKLTPAQKKSFWQAVVQAQPSLKEAQSDLAEIKADLAKIQNPDFLKNLQLDLDLINEKIDSITLAINDANFYAELLPATMGYPKTSRWLIILQNKHELRPTGGFIGTYGIMEISNGEITRLTTDDSYHLDMPVKDKFKVAPPPALKKYLKINNWYFRDSNWSPDWQVSAKKIVWFYQEENKLLPKPDKQEPFDFVIGVTPDLIIDLLDITGPVVIDKRTYTKDNFMELLQSTTEKDYQKLGISSWNRKQEVGRITKVMYESLISGLDKRRNEILDIIKNNLNRKNVLVYSTNQNIASYLESNSWDGRVKETNNDFLMVIDANLAALKTDAVINRNLDYRLEETQQGMLAHLTVNYANTGRYTWKTGKYQTYTRVYVPKGSKLLKAAGFFGDQKDLTIGEELGKTYFGGWLEIEPGKIGNLSFDYLLPDNIWQSVRAKNYQLSLQKQPGSNIQDLRVKLIFNNKIKSYQPQSLHAALAGSQISWKDSLDTDKNFTVSFY